MPFPYAYYKEEYNGPLEAEFFRGKALYLTSPPILITNSGIVDIKEKSHVAVATDAGDVLIDGFDNSSDGQLIFIYKPAAANNLVIKHANTSISTGKVYMSNNQDLVFGHGSYGGATFICREHGGIFSWFQIDSNSLFANGSEAFPSMTFAGDKDTGLWRKAANEIAISANGLEKFSVGTSGIRSVVPHMFSKLFVSDSSADLSLTPTDGIYAKGNIKTSGLFDGTAMSAKFADLAECYSSDLQYAPGTLVMIGGSKEITIAKNAQVFGVISTAPGFLLGHQDKNKEPTLPVALFGKVPCRVIGKVSKGESIGLHPSIPGVAAAGYSPRVGIALEVKTTEEEELIMISTRAVI